MVRSTTHAGRPLGARKATPASATRQRCWTSMRVMRRFTSPDIASTARAGSANVDKYLRALAAVGVIRRVRARMPYQPGSCGIYQLIKDLGPLAPVLHNDGTVTDANSGRVLAPPQPQPEEATA